jgi:methylenetetrahydrofolate reductase (NADH)
MKTETDTRSHLEKVLRSGEFAVTAELNPPDTTDPDEVDKVAAVLANVCDAINVTDASGANCHMSSVAMCALLTRAGYEPVFQMSCRDRNRIAMQGDLVGAAAMGVRNVLCLTGDDVTVGDQPEAKRVFDFDSTQLLHTATVMRDQGKFLSGRKITVPPKFFLGAASNPFAPPFDWQPYQLAKKIKAGADFIQSQYCFDLPRFREFFDRVRNMGLDKKVFYLVGVGPLRSDKAAEYLVKHVPGVHIPDDIISRLRKVPESQKREEGIKICIEIIQQLRTIEGVAGVHIMAYRQEETVARIIEDAGLMPRN